MESLSFFVDLLVGNSGAQSLKAFVHESSDSLEGLFLSEYKLLILQWSTYWYLLMELPFTATGDEFLSLLFHIWIEFYGVKVSMLGVLMDHAHLKTWKFRRLCINFVCWTALHFFWIVWCFYYLWFKRYNIHIKEFLTTLNIAYVFRFKNILKQIKFTMM